MARTAPGNLTLVLHCNIAHASMWGDSKGSNGNG